MPPITGLLPAAGCHTKRHRSIALAEDCKLTTHAMFVQCAAQSALKGASRTAEAQVAQRRQLPQLAGQEGERAAGHVLQEGAQQAP